MISRILIVFVVLLVLVGLGYRWLLQSQGLTITSHWRNPDTNALHSGKALSLHLLGLAWDVRTWDQAPGELNRKLTAFKTWLPWGKIIPESDHIHIQFL